MGYFTGIDVSLEVSHFCVVDAAGEVAMEARARGAWAILGCFSGLRLDMEAIGLEAGPLSQWTYTKGREA